MGVLKAAFLFLRALFVPRLKMAVENLALRQQLAVLQRSSKRPSILDVVDVIVAGMALCPHHREA